MTTKLKEYKATQFERVLKVYICFIEAKNLKEAHELVDEGTQCDWIEIGETLEENSGIEPNDIEIEEV